MSATMQRGERPGLTGAEQGLRLAGGILGVVSLGFATAYLVMGLLGRGGRHAEFPFVVNSVGKDALLAILCWILIADVRRFAWAATVLATAHIVLAVSLLVMALWGGPIADGHTWLAPGFGPGTLIWVWMAIDVAVASALLLLGRLAARARYDLRYLPPSAFRAVMALAEVLVLEGDREIAPAEVAGRADGYLAQFTAHGKWKIRLALVALAVYPVLTLHPPFHLMSPEMRLRYVRRRFFDEVADRLVPGWLRSLRQSLIRAAQQICFMGYYGDERAARRVGYVPFSQRPAFAELKPTLARPRGSLSCLGPADVQADDLTADVLVVGTGAGGAALAYELAAQGREVLMLERGRHVDPKDFSEDEATQLAALYSDGGLTLSRDFRFQVLQGMCVGGSTVVNNAVCIELPQRVVDAWTAPDGLDCGLDPDELRAAFTHVREFLPVVPVEDNLNPGAPKISQGIHELGLDQPPWSWKPAEANVADCVGAGLCNLGCAYGRKLSALDNTLPRAQREFGPEAVRVLAECQVEKVVMNGWRARGVEARLSDGRRLSIRADTVVISAGAIASSLILQRSGLGEGQAGQRLAFNIASPVTFDFDEALHSDRGLEISHVLEPDNVGPEGMVFETWYQPVVTMSLLMPGWFEEHRRNMERYAHMTCLGVVVGSKSNGSVSAARFGGGPDLAYTPDERDLRRMKAGIELAARIGFAAKARRVMPATFKMLELNSDREVHLIGDLIRDASDLNVNSAHPQGGNAMCRDATRGVVDPSFRVYGTQNVYVCDASVFPSAITVNPQMTVMALAHVAASRIA